MLYITSLSVMAILCCRSVVVVVLDIMIRMIERLCVCECVCVSRCVYDVCVDVM